MPLAIIGTGRRLPVPCAWRTPQQRGLPRPRSRLPGPSLTLPSAAGTSRRRLLPSRLRSTCCRRWRRFPWDAATSAGHAGLAAELLEHARGILLGEALAVRHGIDDLAGRERGLADAFQRLLHAQQVLSYDDDPAAADRRRQLATEWDGLVGQIRALPGFEGFLRRPRVADLRREAEAGPI